MTNKEIDKLLFMLDTKDLTEIRSYLLRQKRKNISDLRQKIFENYITTTKHYFNNITVPKLYTSDTEQLFTNGVSLYIINSNYFKTNTKRLSIKQDNFVLMEKENFDNYVTRALTKYGTLDSECSDLYSINDEKYTYAEYHSWIDDKIHEEKFDSNEIDIANILLNNPKYSISHTNPILKAESKIGKAYILGYRK